MRRQSGAPQTKLRDLAAIIGALAALAWPIAVVLLRVRSIRLRIGSAVFEVESTARGSEQLSHPSIP
jgi:hypothetical protein